MWLSRRDLFLPCLRQAKYPLAPVFSWPDMNPTLLAQQGQRTCQRRAIHGKAGTQRFLVGLADDGERGQQAELGDFDSGLAKLLVINPRYDPGEAAQVLTRTGQFKQRVRSPHSKRFFLHTRCIYILVGPIVNWDFRSLNPLEFFTDLDTQCRKTVARTVLFLGMREAALRNHARGAGRVVGHAEAALGPSRRIVNLPSPGEFSYGKLAHHQMEQLTFGAPAGTL
jgi:hypothetical protein